LVAGSYKTTALSAKISGTATCTAGGEGDGTCTVTEEKAQVSLTVPGAAMEGTYTMNTLIGDFINRRLIDRIDNSVGGSDVAYELSTIETSDNANPFTDNKGTSALGDAPSEENLYKIDGGMFSPLASQTLADDDAAKTYAEDQYIWLSGETDVYDEPDGVQGQFDLVAYTIKFGGSGNDLGIPVCTQSTDNDNTYCKTNTAGDISYATETHKVSIWFLGEKWIISEMNAPTGATLTNDQDLEDGGSVKLAKESVSGIVNQGESLPVDDLKFHLDDLEAHGGVTNAIISVLDANDNILKKDKVGPGQTKEFNIEGKTYRFHVYKVAPGYTFGAKWADVAIYSKELELVSGDELDEDAGGNENWHVALGWKNEDGQVEDGGTDGFEARPDTLRTIILFSEELDDLTVGGDDEKMDEGAYIPFVQDPVAWKLTYNGLDLTADDRESLSFDLVETGSKSFSEALESASETGGDTPERERCVLYAPYIEVTSSVDNVFTVEGVYTDFDDSGGQYGEVVGSPTTADSGEFWIAMTGDASGNNYFGGPNTGSNLRSGLWCDDEDDGMGDSDNFDGSEDASLGDGIFIEVTNDQYGFAPFWDPGSPYPDGSTWSAEDTWAIAVEYSDIGDGDTEVDEGGVIVVEPGYTAFSSGDAWLCDDGNADSYPTDYELESYVAGYTGGYFCVPDSGTVDLSSYIIGVIEKAGEGTSDDSIDGFIFGVTAHSDGNDFTDATFEYEFWGETDDGGGGSSVQVMSDESDEIFYFYAGPVHQAFSYGMKDDGYITERGTIFNSKDEDSVEFKMAHKLGHAQFTLATTAAAEGEESTCTYTMEVGDEEECSGVTVKLLDVMQTAVCGGEGATAACGDAMSGVSASVVDAEGDPVTMAYQPTPNAYKGLVILDVDAVGVNTLVSVGGDRINTVTASLLEGSPVDWTTESKIVREVVPGSKIVVAGVEMEETLSAANDFVNGIREA